MRFATIDVGTNTAQLLVVEAAGDGIVPVHDVERFVRLGEGVDRRGRIGTAAQERLVSALREHVDTARSFGADRMFAAATSAMRDAANRSAVQDRVREAIGLDVEILSGEEEATWSFAAACAPFDDLDGPVAVVDVGGGSTELIVGRDPGRAATDPASAIHRRVSLDVGCIRLTERCFDGQPPSDDAVERAEAAIDRALSAARIEIADDETVLVGTAGTATALALVEAGPDSSAEHLFPQPGDGGGRPAVLSAACVRDWSNRLMQRSVDEILALHPEAMPGRADLFPVGVLLLDRVLTRLSVAALRVSPYELRYGLALRARRRAAG